MKKLLVAFEVSGPLGGSVELVLTILDKNASPNVLQAFT